MIITDPAAIVISETFGRHLAPIGRLRLKGRERRVANPFTSQAYAEMGLLPAANRGGLSAANQTSAMQRRETPLR